MKVMETGGLFSNERLIDQIGFVVLRFTGKGAKGSFRCEAGGHRWQETSNGRIHSSTVTVAVLVEPSSDEVTILDKDLRYEAYKGGGPGGQNRNKNSTNIRLTHIPTGIQACANTKSQEQNKKLALAVVRARLFDQSSTEAHSKRSKRRKLQVGTGMRADKIRTVAYQRGRVECHKTGRRMGIKRYEQGYVDDLH